jgi:hypothetical protein
VYLKALLYMVMYSALRMFSEVLSKVSLKIKNFGQAESHNYIWTNEKYIYRFLDKFTNYFAYHIKYQQLLHPFFPTIDQKAKHFQSSTAVEQLFDSYTDVDQHQLTS